MCNETHVYAFGLLFLLQGVHALCEVRGILVIDLDDRYSLDGEVRNTTALE